MLSLDKNGCNQTSSLLFENEDIPSYSEANVAYDPFNVVSKECMPMVEQLFLVSISSVITPTPSKFS
jgi:hypothetical protein